MSEWPAAERRAEAKRETLVKAMQVSEDKGAARELLGDLLETAFLEGAERSRARRGGKVVERKAPMTKEMEAEEDTCDPAADNSPARLGRKIYRRLILRGG